MEERNDKEKRYDNFAARIKVIGVGGGGCNAVNSMIGGDLEGADFIVANTDIQSLKASPVGVKIQIGSKITRGLGAGANPDIGRRSAEEDIETIVSQVAQADILFITAGLGGGTGTGAAPVIANAARELGILTVAVVTKPFEIEGKRRMKQAEAAIEALRKEVDTLIVIPNQKLLEIADAKVSVLDAFALANDVLKQAIKGVADIIVKPGHINVDFADVKTIMKGSGMALMGTGRCKGEDRARRAALNAISSPLVENVCIDGAKGVLINITGNVNLTLHEINDAASVIYEKASEDANIILGSVIDTSMADEEVMVTVIATGFDFNAQKELSKVIPATQKQDYVAKQDIASPLRPPKQAPQVADIRLSKHDSKKEEIGVAKLAEEDLKVTKVDAPLDLSDLDTPTFLRKKAQDKKDEVS